MTWSPDGKWLVGVANSFGGELEHRPHERGQRGGYSRQSGGLLHARLVSRFRKVIFSWRPPGQKANNGYGWTQLWRADAEGSHAQLVYGEEGRHVYGGQYFPRWQVCPVHRQHGRRRRPGHAGAPMGLMRLQDGPIIGGRKQGAARPASRGEGRAGAGPAGGMGAVLDS